MRDSPKAPPHLEEAVTNLLLVTGQLTRRLRAETNSRQLTWSQVAIMARLDGAGPMTTADLARLESVKPQSMGGTLASMEEEGLVERYSHPTDGRQILFRLTTEGLKARKEVRIAKEEWLLRAMARLNPARPAERATEHDISGRRDRRGGARDRPAGRCGLRHHYRDRGDAPGRAGDLAVPPPATMSKVC